MKHSAQSHASSRHFGFTTEKLRPSRLWSKMCAIHGGQDVSARPARGRPRFGLEEIEARVLLSADILPAAEIALTQGIEQFGLSIEQFLAAEDLLDSTRLPFIMQVQKSDSGDQELVAPTLGSLFSLQVDTNGDEADGIDARLLAWDTNGNADGTVDAGEFVQGLLFDKAGDDAEFADWLDDHSPTLHSTANFAGFLADLGTLEMSFVQPGDPNVTVQLTVNSATDLTDPTDPAADLMFGLDFTLTVEQDHAIDLGTEADALKLLMYTGNYEAKKAPTIPVVTTLDLGFTFGARVSGQQSTGQTLDKYDFFVRDVQELSITAESKVVAGDDIDGILNGFDFNLNIGFLGTTVNNATIDYAATVNTLLVDPDSPAVLGFTIDQYGDEQTSGVVTATDAVTVVDLAHGAGFVLRIGNAGIATQVNVAADDNADLAGLLVDINGALVGVGLGGLVTASFDGSDHLVFTLVGTSDTPLGFANESYSAGGTLSATPDGSGGNIWEFTADQNFLLSVGGALPKLVTVRGPDPSHTQIGFNNGQSAAATAVVAPTAATAFDISGDANFTVTVQRNDGSEDSYSFTLTAAETNGNATAADLAADIDSQMSGSAVYFNVLVVAGGDGRLRFTPLAGTTAIRVQASGTATSEIGFATDATATPELLAAGAAVADLVDPARFKLTLTTDSGGGTSTTTYLVVVPDNDQSSVTDLAVDINAAIDAIVGANRIDVSVRSGKIVLTAVDMNVLAFSVVTINENLADLVGDVNQALVEAGFGSSVAASADGTNLKLTAAGGKSLEISHTLTLDAGVTYSELEDTAAADLFAPEADPASNISFKLPIDVIDGLGYDPAHVAIVGNFSPFGELLIEPVVGPPAKPVATIGDLDDRFDLHFNYTPSIADQDTSVPDVFPVSLNEEIRLVNMAEPLNFNLITAESMVGLIMGMGSALQQIANSGTFSGYDIPFADAALADLLNYTDDDKLVFSGLIDSQLVYDTGGTGIDDPTRPSSEWNDTNKLLLRIVDNNGTPGDASDDLAYLIPAFVTAQQLATKLDEILPGMDLTGVKGINAYYDPATNELTYDLDLVSSGRTMDADPTTAEIDRLEAAFEYDVDLGYFVKPNIDPEAPAEFKTVTLQGYTGLDLTFGIDLSPPGTVIYETTKLAELNGGKGVEIKMEHAITGDSGVRTLYSLSADAHLMLIIDGGSPIVVIVEADDTSANTSIGALIGDIQTALDAALSGTVYEGKVVAGYDVDYPTRLKLYAQGGSTIQYGVLDLKDTAVVELGFGGYRQDPAVPGFSLAASTITAQREPRMLVGRLTGDATFEIDITGDGRAAYVVTVPASTTASNRSMADLVADIDNALAVARIDDDIFDIRNLIKADFDTRSRLVLTALNASTEFTLVANLVAASELHLPISETPASTADFVIRDRAGDAHAISLDSLSGITEPNVAQLIACINDQIPGGEVVAGFNITHTGLQLLDKTGYTTYSLRVEPVNGSDALLGLGLFGEADEENQNRITGGQIGVTHLDDRFFVRDAQMWGTVDLQTPAGGIPGTALFGIVGVNTALSGSLYAEFTADIKDPVTGLAGGSATLLQLFEGAKQGRLTQDATFDVTVDGGTPVSITIAKSDTATNNTLADLVADVNKELADASLGSQILARVAGTRIEFISLVKDNPNTLADESVPFTIAPSGTGAAELGLELAPGDFWLTSVNVDGVQTVAARSATRYAVADVAVDEVFALPISGLIGDFAPGKLLYGWDTTPDPDVQTPDVALVINVEYGLFGAERVILSRVSGTFADADIVFQDFGLNGAYKAGALTEIPYGDFTLHVDVQDGFGDLGFADGDGSTSGFGLLDGKDYDVRFNITDFGNPYDPAPSVATFVDLETDTGDLYAFRNLDYADIGSALHDLLAVLGDVNANFDLLTVDLPGINKSISDLLSLVDGFERGVANMDDAFVAAQLALDPGVDLPALRLQDIPRALRGAFGLPEGVAPAADALDFVELDFDKTNGMLLVELNLHESIDTKLGLDINVGSGLPNLTSAGVLKVNGTLDVDLKFGIDLVDTAKAYLFDDSSIAADLHVEGEGQTYETSSGDKAGMGLVFRASIGPLAVFIQDGDALIDAAFALPGLNFASSGGKKLIGDVDFDDFEAPDITENNAEIVLPMFYGGEGPNDYIGDFIAKGQLVDPGTLEKGTLTVTVPDFSKIEEGIADGTIEYDPFDNILLGLDTLNLYLELLSDDLAGDVLGVNLPFVGDQMADILFIENFRDTLYSTLKNGIANDIDPTPADITALLIAALPAYDPFDQSDNFGLDGEVHYTFDRTEGDLDNWYHQWDFTVSGHETIWLNDFVLGIPALDFDVDTAVKVALDWSIDIGFGVNFVEGAYIDLDLSDNVYGDAFTFDGDDVELGLTITLKDGPHTGSLGFLQVKVTEGTPDDGNAETIDKTGALLDFNVEVTGASSARLGFSDIGKLDAVATLEGTDLNGGNKILNLHLDGEMAGVGVLPRVSTNLEVDWFVQGSAPGTGKLLSALTPDPVLYGLDRIAYTGMSMDGGSIVTDFLDPIFGKINEIIQPFMPIVDTLSAPIPVLSDLAGEPFTLLDLAEIFGSVDADFIEAVADMLTLIDKFSDPSGLPIDMPLGSVVLYSRTGPDAGFDPFDSDFDLASIDPATLSADVITDPNGVDPVLTAFDAKVQGSDLLRGLANGEFADNLSLPILTDGFQSIGMLFGRNAVLVDYGLPPLGVEFEYLQVFPVWGPLAVSIEISFGFTVDLHSVGYDTFGLQRYADGGYRNPAVIFDGFYLNDLDAEGVDAPEVVFEFGLVGAAELNLGIARAGVGGGIDAIINFNWYDPINDGRVHISELIANVETADNNPLAVFDVSGALTFQLFAFLEIKMLGIEEEFPITPETELFSFNESFDHDPVWATDLGGGNLMLNIGPSSEDRIYGDISDGPETVTVQVSDANVVTVNGKDYGAFSHIIGIGGQGNDHITLTLDAESTITYELDGGIGDDTITVTGGSGGGTIVGGVGNDSLTGGDGNDVITGGEGNDYIQGSGGHDILFGDQGRVVDSTYADSPYLTSRVTLADGADEIHGGGGDDVAIGAGGDDKLFGDAGGDILIGDGGRFEFAWAAPGQINIASLRPTAFVAPPIVTDNPKTPQQISQEIDAVQDSIVANFHATDLFYGGNDQIEGGADGDMIFGGSGDDKLYGDDKANLVTGADFILAGKGFDEVFGGGDKDHIFGNDQADIISGDGGGDVVSGGSGNDYIHGNDGNDVMKGDSGADVIFGDANDDQIFGQTEPDILFGGTGNDLVVGGTSNDILFGDDGLVAKLDPTTGAGVKVVYNDLVITGSILSDLLTSVTAAEGDAFQDGDIRTVDLILTYVAADDGNDILSGEAADDIMLGGGGNDLMGGDVDPRLPNAGGPTDISEDVLIGDGGMITFDLRRFRSIATVIDPVGAVVPVANDKFDDTIYGDNGNDYIFGGWGSDFLFGGHGKVVDLAAAPGAEVKTSRGATDVGASDNDIILGDNGEIRFADDTITANFGIKELIRTTDESNDTGGHEYVEGELGADVIFGGVNASVDVLFGNAGDDVILGDNGELDFAYGTDTDLDTLDLIRSYRDGLGGEDWISGLQGGDVLVGGTGGDLMYGDDATASSGLLDGEDIMLGDNADVWMMGTDGRLEVQVAEMTTGTAVYLITTTDAIDTTHVDKAAAEACGGADTMAGNAGNDIMLGGVNNDDGLIVIGSGGEILNGIEKDRMYGDSPTPDSTTIANDGDDILLGDNGLLSFSFDPIVLAAEDEAETLLPTDVTFNVAINHDLAVAVTVDDGNYGNLAGLLVAVNAALETAGLDDLIVAEAMDGSIALRAIDPSVAKIAVAAPAGNKLGFGTEQMMASGSGSQVLDLIRSFEDGLGGADIISGNKGMDVAIGGTGGDTIYGDDAIASAVADDLADLLLGDNADIFLVAVSGASGGDLKVVLDAAVKTLRTTDTLDPTHTGGSDTIAGNAKGDIIAGGVHGDTLYGDRSAPTTDSTTHEGDDIILGDNGAFEWLSTGRLDEITGIDIAANNPGLWTKYGIATADADLGTLDLVTTEQPTSGGRDTIYGDQGRDFVFGGTDTDTIYGDDGNETGAAGNNDLLFGDHGRLYPQFSTLRAEGQDWRLAFNSRNFFAIDAGDSSLLISDGGEGDIIRGEEGDDTMLGQQGDDRLWGGAGNDDMTGGHNVAGGYDELTMPAITVTLGQGVNDLMDGGSGDDSMAGDNAIIWRRGDDLSPRFQALTATSIYTTTADTIVANISGTWQSDPADAIGRDIQLVDHSDAVQANPLGRYGNDVMAGGADSDTMFGELGNDLMQGDGDISGAAVADPFISRSIAVVDSGSNPDTDQTLYFNIPELASDGDDYLEGNGGSDLMYGGLGQDDMIGGSSALFGLDDVNAALLGYVGEQLRPDTFDYLYGGAGIATARNDIGATSFLLASEDGTTHVITTTATGHARDADYIMGDNANVYRLVTPTIDEFRTFNYDNYTYDADTETYGLRIIPRAMQQLDYTLGGADYHQGVYIDGAAQLTGQPTDNGGADLIHGESGDDIIFGMTGSDVLFGEGQDDDIVGGYGQDWISGGTGQDGILGDDGLIRTSRNSEAGEPLNAIAGLSASDPEPKYANGNVLDEVIRTPGDIQYAVINLTGELKKTVDLVPFSFDPLWTAMDDEFPDNMDDSPFADDTIFGGLGGDWLHGGSGDDAISGAEALTHAWVPVYDVDGDPTSILDLGYAAVDLTASAIIPGVTQVMAIPGDVLAYNKDDTDGQHLNNRYRAGEFDLYDEYDPRRTVQLDASGNLWKSTSQGAAYEFLLNFDETEGVVRAAGTVPKATGQQTESYPAVRDDGKDAIFGDLGNDWLVGGTGRDNLYGGWGNDLLNADDDHDGHANASQLNDFTDTHPYYEDRAYGGAGRDILIGNTGGDRLIDWVGEYNSYLVPYAPFGQASVSRTLQPFLPEFLYSLSAGDGADPTRSGDTGADPLRNGEPDAEMGLVLQKDFAWQDQTGAPADPQAGNIPGGPRDVLRSATFNDATTQGFAIDSGKWSLQSGVLYVEPTKIGTNALSVWNHDQVLPSYFELTATITPVKPIAGYKANAYIVFDYYSTDDFKFAGINTSTNKIEVGRYTAAGGWQVLASTNMTIKAGTSYNLLVALNGTSATIVVDNKLSVSYTFTPRVDPYGMAHNFNDGMVGLGANGAKASIDNVSLRVLPPAITLTRTDDFSVIPALLAGETGTWKLSKGYYVGTPAVGQTLALAQGSLTVGANYQLQIDTKIATTATGGIVFDQYAADDFKWAAWSKATNQILLGHYTADGGWVVDTAVSRTLTGDVTLSVILKGSTVKVLVNGSVAITHSYNAIVTDGGFGLMARGGTASFDSFTVKTDDPSFVAAKTATLLAAEAPAVPAAGAALTAPELAAIVDAAKARWLASGLLDDEAVALLNGARVQIGNLEGLVLGDTSGNVITIDSDAAGYGWFIDPTPGKDTEFSGHFGELTAVRGGDAWGEMDLLTVLNHELGHIAGLVHDDSLLMAETLSVGVRILPTTTASPAAAEPAAVHPAGLVNMPWSATPGVGPQTGVEHSRSPVIDWQASYFDGGERKLRPVGTRPDWIENFVTRAGKSAAEFNPNASLRVSILASERGLSMAGLAGTPVRSAPAGRVHF